MPVVVGDDLEEVGDATKLCDGVGEFVGCQGVELLPRAVLAAPPNAPLARMSPLWLAWRTRAPPTYPSPSLLKESG